MSNPISHEPLSGNPLGHHIHRENEPLPGARGAASTVDYSPDNIEHSRLPPSEVGDSQNFHPSERAVYHDTPAPETTAHAFGGSTTERSGDFSGPTLARHNEEPLMSPYDIDGQPNQPLGAAAAANTPHIDDVSHKPSIGDKIIGKTEQVCLFLMSMIIHLTMRFYYSLRARSLRIPQCRRRENSANRVSTCPK